MTGHNAATALRPLTADHYAALFRIDLEAADLLSARSAQARAGTLGASDLGRCKEQARRIILQLPHTDDPDKTAAIIGNYVDRGVKDARAVNEHLRHDVRTYATLPNGAVIPCNGDEVSLAEPSYVDIKTKDRDGLRVVRRAGPDPEHRWQAHVNYAGLTQYGGDILDPATGEVVEHFDPLPAEGVVRLVYVDRSGKDPRPVVWQEPYDPSVLDEAAEWLDDVLYAVKHDEEAQKHDNREFCKNYCPFFTACRGAEERIGEERITSPQVDAWLSLLHFAKEQSDELAGIAREMKERLEGMNARSATHRVRSVYVNHKTSPYWRVDTERIGGDQ